MYRDNFYIVPDGVRAIPFENIPELTFKDFASCAVEALDDDTKDNVPLAYFQSEGKFFIVLFDYSTGNFLLTSSKSPKKVFNSLGVDAYYQFERDIYERSKVSINNHPYLKPLRRPCSNNSVFDFETSTNVSLHEVNVGPVHAGIIEPGQFRFTCNGEQVLSVEICLGFQRRGIEQLIVDSSSNRKRMLLAEQISGDSVVANTIAMSNILEGQLDANQYQLIFHERALALEMERLAMHFADLAALAGDCAYYLGQIAIEPLRTTIINSLQLWCGSRSGRSLVRPSGSFYRLSLDEIDIVTNNINNVKKLFSDISSNLLSSPSLLSRLDGKCQLSQHSVKAFALRGTISKASNQPRDIRISSYSQVPYKNFTVQKLSKGDLLSRLKIRIMEVNQSIDIVLEFLNTIKSIWYETSKFPVYDSSLPKSSLILSPVEGFRGTILHVALSDQNSTLADYRIFDPSMMAWPVLAYAMKNQQISDFPVCNKSFNLSYLANDL